MTTPIRIASYLALLLVASVAARETEKSAKSPRFEDLAREFDYDRNALLNIREDSKVERNGATVIELSYDSPRGGRVPDAVLDSARRLMR